MVKNLDKIWEGIFEKRPVLKEILAKDGNQTLQDYAAGFAENNSPVPAQRKSEFINTVAGLAGALLGEDKSKSVAGQLEKHYFVSTADHHGPICHPFFVHSDLLGAVASPAKENYIVLATSNVSLGNSSYPRGLLLHSPKTGSSQMQQFSFFAAKDRRAPVFNMPGFGSKQINSLNSFLGRHLKGIAAPEALEGISNIYGAKEILETKGYTEQVTKTNFMLWRKFFQGQIKLPNLVYLSQEAVALELIIKYHLKYETDIYKLMFDPGCLDLAEKLFDGFPGAFLAANNRGTFLFWGYDFKKMRRVQLRRSKDFLTALDNSFKVHLDAESFEKAFASGEIFPNTMLSLLLFACYYGVKCLGGFSQTTYLGLMAEVYGKIFPASNFAANTKTIAADLIFANLSLAGVQEHAAATGLDLAVYGTKQTYEKFLALTNSMTLKSTLDLVAPYLYNILYAEGYDQEWPQGQYNKNFQLMLGLVEPVINL